MPQTKFTNFQRADSKRRKLPLIAIAVDGKSAGPIRGLPSGALEVSGCASPEFARKLMALIHEYANSPEGALSSLIEPVAIVSPPRDPDPEPIHAVA